MGLQGKGACAQPRSRSPPFPHSGPLYSSVFTCTFLRERSDLVTWGKHSFRAFFGQRTSSWNETGRGSLELLCLGQDPLPLPLPGLPSAPRTSPGACCDLAHPDRNWVPPAPSRTSRKGASPGAKWLRPHRCPGPPCPSSCPRAAAAPGSQGREEAAALPQKSRVACRSHLPCYHGTHTPHPTPALPTGTGACSP